MELARQHHYLFSHVLLRNQALRSAERLIAELRKPTGEGFLFFLWKQIEKTVQPAVSPVGLSLASIHAIAGGSLAIIQMPAPERDTESLFGAIFSGPSGARYFVLDRAVGDPGQATLAELRMDPEMRINCGRHAPTREALLEAITAELGATTPAPGAPTTTLSTAPPFGGTPSAFGAQPSAFGAPASSAFGSKPPSFAPASNVPRRPASKKTSWIVGGAFAVFAPMFCCLGTLAMAYDSGLDADSELRLGTTVSADSQDREQLVIEMYGDDAIDGFRVEGPGADHCGYLGYYEHRCAVDLSTVAEARPSYRVTAHGSGPRLFGSALGDQVQVVRTERVVRPLELRFSEVAHTTIVRGMPGRLEITPQGSLRLVEGALGASLAVGSVASGGATAEVPLDLTSVVDQVGIAAILRDGGRVSVPGVRVCGADGSCAQGVAQFLATDFAPALVDRFSRFDQADLGPATGTAVLWLANGRLQEMTGEPRVPADVARVIVSDEREERAGQCGPYTQFGMPYGGDMLRRWRWVTEVVVFDRVESRRVSSRTFRADRPRCPEWISSDTTEVHGDRSADGEAFARAALYPSDPG